MQRIIALIAAAVLAVITMACAKRSRDVSSIQSLPSTATANERTSANQQSGQRININTASAKELETLPGIGQALAERIIEHRNKYGPFRKPEHLIIVRGISEGRFRALRDLITVE